jgi:hypothetical protein
VLNRMIRAFLYPPDKLFLSAIATDFKKSLEVTIPSIVRQLFASTTRYFFYPELVPDHATLVTFRNKSSGQIMAIFKEHSYFHHPKDLNYGVFLFFWSIGLSLLGVVVKIRRRDLAAVFSYAAALTLVGLFIMFANCVVNVFQPRYALPMWELTIVSLFVLFGAGIGPLFQHCDQALSTGSRARKIAFGFGK